jgi:hypothetical protein
MSQKNHIRDEADEYSMVLVMITTGKYSFNSWLQILSSNIKNVIDSSLRLKQNTDSNGDDRNR